MIRNKLKEQRTAFIVIFFVSLFLVLPQILNHSLILGDDSIFHFNRIYDVYMQFKTGNFNYFQSNYGFQQSGRIVNAVYGPGLAYVFGIILLAVHSWLKFQILTSFLIFFVSGYSMYFLSRAMNTNKKVSLLVSILFMSSFWITHWEVDQGFMAWGVMMMPLIVLMGLRMISKDAKDLKIIPLALVVSLIVQIHVLSALMAIIVLISFFVIGMIQTVHKRELLIKCSLAGLLAVVLTFNVWGAMLDVFTTNTLYSPFSVQNMSDWTANISMGEYDYGHLGLVMSLIFILQIIFMFSKKYTVSLANKVVTINGIIFLILSSNIIPWVKLAMNFPQLQSFLQFPYRFNGFAMVLLLAGFGASISNLSPKSLRKNLEIGLVIGCAFILFQSYSLIQNRNEFWNSSQPIVKNSGIYYSKHYSNDRLIKNLTSVHLGSGLKMIEKFPPDYLPEHLSGVDSAADRENVIYNNNDKSIKKTVENGSLIIRWTAKKKGEIRELPIIIYSNSVLSLNNHNITEKKMKLSSIGSPKVISDKKGENILKLEYHSNLTTNTRLVLVMVAWVISFMSMIVLYLRRIR
ncbi:MFS transporter [Dellaglioa algida]|uniref:MFS transporter n=1 Tax=Dellaglioa algida TaxID=105612 RepID=UPI0024C4D237|nr:MFS transporter [Dellaglioa algida]MDK1724730.1 MFS transporter [Dellaglioa algida]MDK1738730.1 MFS transporter [Dellaglioa algida]